MRAILYRRLDIILAILILSAAALKSCIELHLYKSLKFHNDEILFLLMLLLPFIVPCLINLSISYL